MRKYSALFLVLILVFILGSCDAGTPPELYLSFFIDDLSGTGTTTVLVDYTIENGGEDDLENCKLQFGVDTSDDDNKNYTVTKWTTGVDLSSGESRSVSNFSISAVSSIYDVYVIAAGFDNPVEEDKSAKTTVIYYNE